GSARKESVLQLGPQRSQHRGSKHDAAEQHAHDGGLTYAIHGLAEEAPDDHQRDELGEKDDLRRAALAALGRTGDVRAEHQRSDCADAGAGALTCRGGIEERPIHGGSSPLNPGEGRLFLVEIAPLRGNLTRPKDGMECHAIANYLQQGYGGGKGSSAWPFPPCRKSAHHPLRITPKRAGVAAAARRRCPKSLAPSPRGHAGRCGRSSWRFLARAIWWRSATWIPAIGRPRSPAAPSSATRCWLLRSSRT